MDRKQADIFVEQLKEVFCAETITREMSVDLLKRARFLVVCGEKLNDDVKEDVSIAKHSKVIPTTLAGILQCG